MNLHCGLQLGKGTGLNGLPGLGGRETSVSERTYNPTVSLVTKIINRARFNSDLLFLSVYGVEKLLLAGHRYGKFIDIILFFFRECLHFYILAVSHLSSSLA